MIAAKLSLQLSYLTMRPTYDTCKLTTRQLSSSSKRLQLSHVTYDSCKLTNDANFNLRYFVFEEYLTKYSLNTKTN